MRAITDELAEALTVPAAAKLLGVHRQTIYRWVNEERLSALHIGPRGAIRIPREELEKLVTITRAW